MILLITDAIEGVTQADHEVVNILRRRRPGTDNRPTPPVLLVVNKADSHELRLNAMDFYSLGLGEPYPISAIHGTGTGDLLDAVVECFPPEPVVDEEDDTSIKVAIVGKPNAGKSSLLNKLAGAQRSIVSNIPPGTTRDAIDTKLSQDEQEYTLIDTAGIRKRGSIEPGVENIPFYAPCKPLNAVM